MVYGYAWNHLFLPTLTLCIGLLIGQVTGKEYCQNEKFTAQCQEGEIIVMSEALYGRMNKSRCVEKDYGYISCVTDVLDVADHYCSGRQECMITVPDSLLDARKLCPKDLIAYLHASYHCQKAILTKRSCANQKQIEIKAEGGLLASLITRQTECGSPKSPYIIRAGNGQRLNFTLHDYSYIGDIDDDGQLPSNQGSRSVSYANLRDGDDIHSHRKTVYGTNRRTTHGFLSETHVVQVILFGGMAGRYFALEYQVIGCSDPTAPPHGWVKRSGDRAVLGCDDSSTRKWKLLCVQNRWKLDGKSVNCSLTVRSAATQWDSVSSMMSIDIEFALALIAGIAFVIATLVILIGIIFIRRNYHRHSTPRQMSHSQWPRNLDSQQGQGQSQGQQEVGGKYSGSIRSQENEYASIQENLYGTNSRSSKYIHINLCHQGEPVGAGGGGGLNTSSVHPDLVPNGNKKEVDCVQYPEPKVKYRLATAVVNNKNSGNNGDKKQEGRQYFVVSTGEPTDVMHDERAYSY